MEIFDFFDEAHKQRSSIPGIPHPLKTVLALQTSDPIELPKPSVKRISLPTPAKKKPSGIQKEYVRAKAQSDQVQRRAPLSPRQTPKHVPMSKKSSIFTRVAKFKLPNGKRSLSRYEPIKPDVKPRKDFKNIQRVVNDYIKRRNNKLGYRRHEVIPNKHEESLKKVTLSPAPKIEINTEIILNKAEEEIIDLDHSVKPKGNTSTEDTKHFDVKYEEGDNKLMTLLDTLEREVKHIELDGDEKEIFDAKIRKIYGSVVGKSVNLLNSNNPKPKPKPKVISQIQTMLPPPHRSDRDMDFIENDFGESKVYIKHETNRVNEDDPKAGHDSDRLSDDDRNIYKHNIKNKHKYAKKYEYNHVAEDELKTRHDFDRLSDDDRNIYKQEIDKQVNRIKNYEYLDHKYDDKTDKIHNKHIEDKYSDIYDNKSFNDDILSDNDQRSFSDIERKYNERLAKFELNKLDRKYQANGEHKFTNSLDHKNDILDHNYDDGGHKYTNMPASRNQNNMIKYEGLRHRLSSDEDKKHRIPEKYHERELIGGTRGDTDKNSFRNVDDERKYRKGDNKRSKNFRFHKELEHEDPLSTERRKYYQDKLENLERKLHDTRSYRRRKNENKANERGMRRMRPSLSDVDRPRSKAQGDSFYMPDRARFLHGF